MTRRGARTPAAGQRARGRAARRRVGGAAGRRLLRADVRRRRGPRGDEQAGALPAVAGQGGPRRGDHAPRRAVRAPRRCRTRARCARTSSSACGTSTRPGAASSPPSGSTWPTSRRTPASRPPTYANACSAAAVGRSCLERAARRGEVPDRVWPPGLVTLPFDLFRHDLAMTLARVPEDASSRSSTTSGCRWSGARTERSAGRCRRGQSQDRTRSRTVSGSSRSRSASSGRTGPTVSVMT